MNIYAKVLGAIAAIILAVIAIKLWWPSTLGFGPLLHLGHHALLVGLVALKAGKFVIMGIAALIAGACWMWSKLTKRESVS